MRSIYKQIVEKGQHALNYEDFDEQSGMSNKLMLTDFAGNHQSIEKINNEVHTSSQFNFNSNKKKNAFTKHVEQSVFFVPKD